MHSWLTIPQWLTVSSLTSKCETTLSSPLLSLLPVCFSSVSSLSPSQLSLPHSPFSFFLSLVILSAQNPLHIHPRFLNQISISNQQRVCRLKTESAGASDQSACRLHSSLLLSCHCTDESPSLFRCLFTVYLLVVVVAHSFTKRDYYEFGRVPHFSLCDESGIKVFRNGGHCWISAIPEIKKINQH